MVMGRGLSFRVLAFGDCVGFDGPAEKRLARSRGAAKGAPKGKANFDMINMINMIFDGLAAVLGGLR